jgi:N-dimethylarginine dimethylaminohydrolase
VQTFEFGGAFFGPDKHNLLFARDLFFMTPAGAVVSRMASVARAGEEKHAARALAALGVPIVRTISGEGTFEGADALWLRPDLVVCGVGNRTNAEGFRQLRDALRDQGVRAVDVPMPPGVQHLLGILQLVDRDLALVRIERAPESLLALLARLGIETVAVPDLDEVTQLHGMNVVAVGPRRLVMPGGCPMLERLYAAAGLRIAARLDIPQTARAAGGIACSVGILSRR